MHRPRHSRRLALLLTFEFSLLCAPSWAARGDIRDALDKVEDAIELVQDEGGRCKRSVLRDLKDLRADLRDLRSKPKRRGLRHARRLIRDLRDHAEDCPRRVQKKLRRAKGAIEDALDALDEVSERRTRKAKKPKSKVPHANFGKDCIEMWFMHRLIQTTTNKAQDLKPVENLSRVACESGLGKGQLRWPNGRTARFANGEWRYPNGRTARFANGEWRYPTGRTAKFANGEWRYPSGRTAKFANGQWRYPNGRNAGTWQSVQAWACGKLGDARCRTLKAHYESDIVDWRDYALVNAAFKADKR